MAITALVRPLVLAPPRGRLRAGARWVLITLLVAAGVGVGYLRGQQQPPPPAISVDADDPLRRQLDEALASLRIAQAHGGELERQIDALQARLQAAQEELSFLRQAREAQRPPSRR
jgi:hypothetical protein